MQILSIPVPFLNTTHLNTIKYIRPFYKFTTLLFLYIFFTFQSTPKTNTTLKPKQKTHTTISPIK